MRSDPGQMHSVANRVSSLADEFWDDVDGLRRQAEELMTADWTGDAAGTHAPLWTEWVDSARQVSAALSNDAALLHQAADGYSATDDASAADLDGIRLDI